MDEAIEYLNNEISYSEEYAQRDWVDSLRLLDQIEELKTRHTNLLEKYTKAQDRIDGLKRGVEVLKSFSPRKPRPLVQLPNVCAVFPDAGDGHPFIKIYDDQESLQLMWVEIEDLQEYVESLETRLRRMENPNEP